MNYKSCLQPPFIGPLGRQVGQDTRLDGPPSNWGQATGDHQFGLGHTEVYQPSKRIPTAGGTALPNNSTGEGMLTSLWVDPQRIGTSGQTHPGLTRTPMPQTLIT